MELHTINHVSKTYGISTRMLRYYEEIGLISSRRKADYAYRVYDEAALSRLEQIIALRKLRVPMKHITVILGDWQTAAAVDIFLENIRGLDAEIKTLNTIRDVLIRLANEFRQSGGIPGLADSSVFSIIKTLSFPKNLIKEKSTMENQQTEVRTMVFGKHLWRILEEKDGKALIFAANVIRRRDFHSDLIDITWEHSEMRQYLNGAFYQTFTAKGQSRILETQVSDRDNPWTGTKWGNGTTDKVFLLSYDEVIRYLGDSGDMKNHVGWHWGHVEGVGSVAVKGGAEFINDQHNEARKAVDVDNKTAWWWLRSPGGSGQHTADSVGGIGEIFMCGDDVFNHPHRDEFGNGGVRPTMWIKLQPEEV